MQEHIDSKAEILFPRYETALANEAAATEAELGLPVLAMIPLFSNAELKR